MWDVAIIIVWVLIKVTKYKPHAFKSWASSHDKGWKVEIPYIMESLAVWGEMDYVTILHGMMNSYNVDSMGRTGFIILVQLHYKGSHPPFKHIEGYIIKQ